MALPINITDLITGQTVEWERIEFKEGWNPEDILHSLCAFANDINNWGGGYLVLGIGEIDGKPILPPKGLQLNQIDAIQKKLLELCHRVTPAFFPIAEPVLFQKKHILVLWCPGGEARPYKAPISLKGKSHSAYYVRRFSNTVRASHSEEHQLIELAARIPFDDRIHHQASIADLKLPLIQSFLKEVGSHLFEESSKIPVDELCRQMNIARGADEFLRPVNVGLLFFNDQPESFFKGAKIEIVEYHDEVGDTFSEKIFTGPIHFQLKDALRYIQTNILKEEVRKIPGKAKADRFFNYPFEAIKEALANAVYHRSYEHQSTIEVSIRPKCIEILSFPGPVPPVDNNALKKPRVVARDYRNRRVGDFLKELHLTEGRSTGIPKIRRAMNNNGSPKPKFETDKEKTYFLTTLPIHRKVKPQVEAQVEAQVESIQLMILNISVTPKSRKEILEHIGLSNHTKNYKRYIQPLIEQQLLGLTIPEKPTSGLQRYVITSEGLKKLKVTK